MKSNGKVSNYNVILIARGLLYNYDKYRNEVFALITKLDIIRLIIDIISHID